MFGSYSNTSKYLNLHTEQRCYSYVNRPVVGGNSSTRRKSSKETRDVYNTVHLFPVPGPTRQESKTRYKVIAGSRFVVTAFRIGVFCQDILLPNSWRMYVNVPRVTFTMPQLIRKGCFNHVKARNRVEIQIAQNSLQLAILSPL